MKCLTLTQPWASLVICGAKEFETRSWSTTYRGPLAIHAAKGYPKWARKLRELHPFVDELSAAGIWRLPTGCVLGIVDLCSCQTTESIVEKWKRRGGGNLNYWGGIEHAFGDYTPGRFAWGLKVRNVFDDPVPARGALGMWNWELPE